MHLSLCSALRVALYAVVGRFIYPYTQKSLKTQINALLYLLIQQQYKTGQDQPPETAAEKRN
jgi:hypothetical protein